jgi:hypothetical protein
MQESAFAGGDGMIVQIGCNRRQPLRAGCADVIFNRCGVGFGFAMMRAPFKPSLTPLAFNACYSSATGNYTRTYHYDSLSR